MTKPLYFYNGTTFELVGPTTPQSPIAYQTSAPTAPATGDLWIDSDGDVDTYNRQLTRYYFVATAGQTTISGVDANSLTLAYVAGSEAVYVNGALQVRGQDYTATNGTSVVLSSALAVNDVVEIFAYTAFTVANAYTKSETDGVAAAAAGLRMVVPTSVSVGSGSGSVDAIGNVTFSGASSISINSCFTSTYDNYRIIIDYIPSASTGFVSRYRNTSDETAASYGNAVFFYRSNNTSGGEAANTSATYSYIMNQSANGYSALSIDVINPLKASYSLMHILGTLGISSTDVKSVFGQTMLANTSTYSGVTFYPLSGTITGTIRVYGYKD
jgi:hypothetical protein